MPETGKHQRGPSRNPNGRKPMDPQAKKVAVTFYIAQNLVDALGGMAMTRIAAADMVEMKAKSIQDKQKKQGGHV